MAAGPQNVCARLPTAWRGIINRRYRLPIDCPCLLLGIGANIRGNEMLEHPGMRMVLQLEFDDMMYWSFGDNGAYQFWMPEAALRPGGVSTAGLLSKRNDACDERSQWSAVSKTCWFAVLSLLGSQPRTKLRNRAGGFEYAVMVCFRTYCCPGMWMRTPLARGSMVFPNGRQAGQRSARHPGRWVLPEICCACEGRRQLPVLGPSGTMPVGLSALME